MEYTTIKVRPNTHHALKIASARLRMSIIDLLVAVEHGDKVALLEWIRATKEITNENQ